MPLALAAADPPVGAEIVNDAGSMAAGAVAVSLPMTLMMVGALVFVVVTASLLATGGM